MADSRIRPASGLSVTLNEIDVAFGRTTPNEQEPGAGYEFMARDLKNLVLGKQTSPDDVEEYELNAAALAKLIELKKQKRPIDCHVVIGDLESLLNQLQKQIVENSAASQRVQAVYKLATVEDEHWSALDILVTANKIKVFYLDASGDPRNLQPIAQAIFSIPNAELTICEEQIQHDGQSCSIFALDHVFHLSKIPNLHAKIDIIRKSDTDLGYKEMYMIDPIDLPAVLVKDAQSLSFLTSFFKKHKEAPCEIINKKGQTLFNYVQSHVMFAPIMNKNVNTGIQHKQINYTNRLK